MSFIHDDVLDLGLQLLTRATRLSVCAEECRSLDDVTRHALGHKDGITVSGPEPRRPHGRQVRIAAINDGIVTKAADGAAYWTLTDGSRVLASAAIQASTYVARGGQFTLSAFVLGFPAQKAT